ncbi:hypothetical protein Ahy_A02g006606 [Arachis hypogaea]|uniref:Uncharacterized protein n=1 Tax=Arachis hypogaea TaxID=3818 RepID=A0A445EA49_ARAHY|nr:hypothetical protein Ahy_A02g006606 [Arachis hypogaea]
MKDELFKGFLEKHEFASNYDKAMARTVWNRTILDRYPDILKRVRERAFKEANSTSIADIKGHGPKTMKVDVWNDLVDHWLDSKWKNKSVASQKIELLCLLINYILQGLSVLANTREEKYKEKHCLSQMIYDTVF